MKVKIKGLVFVGFAAAILSANAMAAQRTRPAGSSNTVTSQAFTEAKYEWLSDKVGTTPAGNSPLWDSEDAYPSMAVLSGVMDTIDSNQVTGSDYIDTDTSGDHTQVLIKDTQIADTATEIDTGGTPLTTAGAVKSYVNVRGVKVNGTALTPDTVTKDVDVTVIEGAGDGTIKVNGQDVPVHNAEVTTHKLVQGTNTGSVINDQATDTQYPSAKAVYNALTDTSNVGNGTISATQNGADAGSFTVNQSGAGSITIAAPNWDQATTTAADYIANKPTISNAAADITGAAATDTKELPTTYAVQQYVQLQTGGTVIPAMDTTVCSATTPCALVAEASGAVHWRTMATATDAGGACGDATGNCQ